MIDYKETTCSGKKKYYDCRNKIVLIMKFENNIV